MSRTRSGGGDAPRGPQSMTEDELASYYLNQGGDSGSDGGGGAAAQPAARMRLNKEKEKKKKELKKEQHLKEKKGPSKLASLNAALSAAEAPQQNVDTQMLAYSQSQLAFSNSQAGNPAPESMELQDEEEEDPDDVDISKYLNDGEEPDDDEEDDAEEGNVDSDPPAISIADLLFTSAGAVPQKAVPKAAVAVPKVSAPADEEGAYLDDAAVRRQEQAQRAKQQIEAAAAPKAAGGAAGARQRQQGANYIVAEPQKAAGGAAAASTATAASRAASGLARPVPFRPNGGQQAPPSQVAAPPPSNTLRFYWLDAREDGSGLMGTGGTTHPGHVYLFGKLLQPDGSATSCCLRVGGLQRQVFFLPRKVRKGTSEPLPMVEVQKEVAALCSRVGIAKRKVQVRDRWYAFEEPGVPRDRSQWIKLSYPASFRELNITPNRAADVQNYMDTVTHAFGDRRSFLEMFLLKKRLKGPAWLDISGFERVSPAAQMSHCSVEFSVPSYKTLSLAEDWMAIPPPKLKAMSLSLCTDLVERGRGQGSHNEIFGATALFYGDVDVERPRLGEAHPSFRWAAVRQHGATPLPPPHQVESAFRRIGVPPPAHHPGEGHLLDELMRVVAAQDPDIIVGHNFMSFDLDVLLHRLSTHSIKLWDRLGRMRLKHMPKLQQGAGGQGESTWEERSVLGGRLIADTYLLAHEYHKTSNYKLRSLALELKLWGSGITSEDQIALPPLQLDKALADPQGVLEVVSRTDQKAVTTYSLVEHLQAIPLTKRLTFLAGNLWSRTLTGSRAERTEYLLLHDFYRQKYVLPDKRSLSYRKGKTTGSEANAGDGAAVRRKAKYAGGMVLEPKKGLYTDYVLLLDFNSLYPSLIQEYKVCFTTVARGGAIDVDAGADGDEPVAPLPEDKDLYCSACKDVHGSSNYCVHKGILPKAIFNLVQDRRNVKNLIKKETDPSVRSRYDVIQKALKLTANSIYGCLGFEHSRFYAQKLAELVTFQGREALSSTVDLVGNLEGHNLSVVYGDTDSVMLSTSIPNTAPVSQATEKAQVVKQAVNQKYSNLEIDIDGVFKSILLVRKKKYAAINIKDWNGRGVELEKEVKGLDMVRRDWCKYTSQVQQRTLDFCLSGDDEEVVRSNIITALTEVAAEVRSSNCHIDKFVITKSLTKDPSQYLDNTQPHVTVALRMRTKHKTPVKVGDYIYYIICTPESAQGYLGTGADTKKLCNRAFSKEEIIAGKLTIDKEWYLTVQFHPPISRLTEHIPGLDSHVIAHCFGIEDSAQVQHTGGDGGSGQTGDTGNGRNEPYLITAAGTKSVAERYFPLQLLVPCATCKKDAVVDPHENIIRLLEGWDDDLPHCTPASGLFRCQGCKGLVDMKLVGEFIVRNIRTRQLEYYADPSGYEVNFLAENADAHRVSDRHARDYVDFAKALFSIHEWTQVIVNHAALLPDAQKAKFTKEHSNLARTAVEKVMGLMTEMESTHCNNIACYLTSVSRKFARNTVDVGNLFGTIVKFSGR